MTSPAFAALSDINTAKIASRKKVIFHKHKSTFIDIEVPIDQAWVGCTQDGPTPDTTSGMVFYALDGDTTYMFFYRRVYDVQTCLEEEKRYRKIMRGAKTVRLVGGRALDPDIGPQPSEKRIPRRFTSTTKTISQVFVRMQTGKGCQSYFSEDCQLPENYWAGTMPDTVEKVESK